MAGYWENTTDAYVFTRNVALEVLSLINQACKIANCYLASPFLAFSAREGVLTPNVELESLPSNRREVRIEIEILEKQSNEAAFKKAAGILKHKKIDPLKFQSDQRSEWDG